ncbi:hypothetical protein SAMN05421839_1286 [Halolactibacillus halophilus]|uniref:Uncharacterized protein n=1 Tax=Halolactibacillus halophilus TaxID=306540 RepID=A0A1I5R9B7_9BACI|nr:hypothetical protein [Halolactibacillus halophilus]GEM02956.1 hypothetical protein HHA03_24880 [Halolactibacillus halophilus]SFP55134.1 hypothetical protein SAMN05421839_1286 [Halolactibacillus halophilus]
MKKVILTTLSVLLLGMASPVVAYAESVNVSSNTVSSVNTELLELNDNVKTKVTALENSGYQVDSQPFQIQENNFLRFYNDSTYGVIELKNDGGFTVFHLEDQDEYGYYKLIAETQDGEQFYKEFNEQGEERPRIVPFASVCDWVVGGSGVALSGIYGAAIGTAFGGLAGGIAGAACP